MKPVKSKSKITKTLIIKFDDLCECGVGTNYRIL